MENMDMLNANIMSLIEMLKQMGAADAGAPQAQEAPQPEAPVEMAKAKEGDKEDKMEDKKEDEAQKAVSVQTPDNAATASDKTEGKIDDDSKSPGTAAAEATMKAMGMIVKQLEVLAKEVKAQKSLNSEILEALNITEKSLFAPAPAAPAPVQKGYTAPAQSADVLKSLADAIAGLQKQPEVQKSRGEQVQDLTVSAAKAFMGMAE